jgi:hypothetical protein
VTLVVLCWGTWGARGSLGAPYGERQWRSLLWPMPPSRPPKNRHVITDIWPLSEPLAFSPWRGRCLRCAATRAVNVERKEWHEVRQNGQPMVVD